MKKSKKRRLKAIFFLPLITLGLLMIIFLLGILQSIPNRAEQLYGPPAPGISGFKRCVQSALLVWHEQDLNSPASAGGSTYEFQISPGESPRMIINRLHRVGLIHQPDLFRTYLVYSGADTRIQAGSHPLSPSLTPLQIAEAIQDPAPGKTTLTVLPGWRVEEIAQTFPRIGLSVSQEEFLQQVKEDKSEGFLFPGTYQVQRKTTASELLTLLREQFQEQVPQPVRDAFLKSGLSLEEAVTLASIVQREAVLKEEMPLIASVFWNRLEAGMPLEADPTVQYAVGYNQEQDRWWTNPLSNQDLAIPSPYNTYLNTGLPPGPICNPGLPALQAVANPAITPYYYFRASCDGSGQHLFAETYQEHLENACP